MTKYVALLRGLGPGKPGNDKLKKLFEKLGFANVQTIISSGNVIFESSSKNSKELENKIEKSLPKEFGFKSTTIIRTKSEIARLIKVSPFKNLKENAKEKPNVTFFKNTPAKDKLPTGGRGFKAYGFEEGAFCYTVDMTSIKTPEAMLTLEKQFGKEITTRTWKTVHRIISRF